MSANVRTSGSDAGFTLVELLVVMVIMGLVGAMVTTWFVTAQRTSAGYTARVADQASARVALDQVTKDLRMAIKPSPAVAPFLASSTGQQLEFYVNVVSGVPRKVRYFTEAAPGGGTRLVREVTPPAAGGTPYAWPAAGAQRRVLVSQLGSGSFSVRYFAIDTTGQPPCGPGVPSPCATPLAASPLTSVDDVGSVEVALSVGAQPRLAPAAPLTTRVRLTNARQVAIVEGSP